MKIFRSDLMALSIMVICNCTLASLLAIFYQNIYDLLSVYKNLFNQFNSPKYFLPNFLNT